MYDSDQTKRNSKAIGPSNLIAAVCYELQIPHYVDSLVQWDEKQWKVSPGTLILGLITNILVQRRPLYLVKAFYKNMGLPMLFDEPMVASDFNDDALERALDRIMDGKTLFKTVGCQATIVDDIEIRTVHADTTSISLYGEFVPSDCDVQFEEARRKDYLTSPMDTANSIGLIYSDLSMGSLYPVMGFHW